jgi:hypothetical protein
MKPAPSLPRSNVSATCPYPETDQSSPCLPCHFLKIHFNIITPSTPGSSFHSGLPTKNLNAPLLYPILATRPAHLVPFDFITHIISCEAACSLNFSYSLLFPHLAGHMLSIVTFSSPVMSHDITGLERVKDKYLVTISPFS